MRLVACSFRVYPCGIRLWSVVWLIALLGLALLAPAQRTWAQNPQVAQGTTSNPLTPTFAHASYGSWGIYNPSGTLIAAGGPPTPGPNGWNVSFTTGYNGQAFIATITVTVPASAPVGAGYIVAVAGPGTNNAAYFDVVASGGGGGASLTTLTLAPTSVIGGNNAGGTMSIGTVTLSGPAPTGGVTVNLSSSNTALATVPSTVTVAAGSTSNTFSVTTSAVTSTSTVTISATYGGTTKTATLTIRPWLNTLSFSPSSVVGNSSSTGTISLNTAAPSGGLTVTLVSNNTAAATVPATVTVPEGQTSTTFSASSSTVTVNTSVTITATYSNQPVSASLTVMPLLASLSLSPASLVGGGNSTGTVTLNGPAPSGGVSIALSSSNSTVASVPASLTIAAGSASGTFTITTTAVTNVTSVTISAAYGGVNRTATLTVNPLQVSLSLNPTTVVGGDPSTGTVTLNGAAPSGGITINLSSSNTSVAAVPATMTIAAGATSGAFTITTTTVTSSSSAMITASYGGLSSRQYLSVVPLLASLSLNPSRVIGGNPSTATVTLNGPAPAGGVTITLSSSNTAAATTPDSVQIAAGATSATFTVNTLTVTASSNATIKAVYAGAQATAYLTVLPLMQSLYLNPSTVYGGGTSTGTVTLNAPAPTGGVTITLSSDNTAVATTPASLTIAAGSSNGTFTITTTAVTASSTAHISATSGGQTLTQPLTVIPLLAGISVNPARIIGGSSATGTVTLNGPAPSGGITVALSSDNTAAATVPSGVSIASGATSATFTVSTSQVTASATANLSATYNGVTKSTQVTVVPLLSSLSVNPATVVGGDPSTGTLSFNGPVPAGGVSITLSSSNTAVATVPATLSVAAGVYSATFTISTLSATAVTTVTISATYDGVTKTATLTVNPMPTVLSMTLSPGEVTGGNSSHGTVTLSGIAPAAGASVALSSDTTAVATVPAGITVPSGSSSAGFTVTTLPTAATTTATISGSYNSSTKSGTLTVDRPALTGFTVSPTTLVGGNGTIGTLTLNGNAPVGSVTINLSCAPDGGASFPASVTIPAGTRTTTVAFATSTVNYPTTLTLTATNAVSGGESLTATVSLTVGTIHATDIFIPKALQLQWNLTALGSFVLTRDGVTIATLPNTTTSFMDVFAWNSAQTYQYDIYDNNSTPAVLLSTERVAPYQIFASQDQAVDSRLDLRYSANVFLDHQFGTSAYKGGLFAGFDTDPSRIGRSFAQFALTGYPSGGVYRTGKINAYFVAADTPNNNAANVTVGCQTLANNTWSAPTLHWTNAPPFDPTAATKTITISYDPKAPSGLTAVGGTDQVALSWTPPAVPTPVASYTVQYGPYPGYYPQQVTGITGTSATITGLSNGTTYYFVVASVDGGGVTGPNSAPVSTTPPDATPIVTPPHVNYWASWLLVDDIQAALLRGDPLYSVAWASMNETQQGWAYFAKTEYDPALGPNVTHLWSIPTLVKLEVPPSVSLDGAGSTSATGIVTVNGIGLQGSAVVTLSSNDGRVTVPASITVTGLSRTFTMNVATGSYTATISATFGGVTKTATMSVSP